MQLFAKQPKLNILFVTSEEAPFAKVGGLGDVMFSLPRALCQLGHDARVMIPRYGTIDLEKFHLPVIYKGLDVPTAPNSEGKRLNCNVRMFRATDKPQSPVTTYFLENQEYYELRSNVYGYADDRIRFALLSRGCLEFFDASHNWTPDIIVGTDWMTGHIANYLKTDYRDHARLQHIATVFSIHNLESQGTVRPTRFLSDAEQDDGHGPIPDMFGERMQYVNTMRRGIMYADYLNTVSRRYVEEITTEEFGEGLDGVLRSRRDRLYGILNGIDYTVNDPDADPSLAKNFTRLSLGARTENKIALQKRFGLPQNKEAFVIGIVSRLTRQKGLHLLQPVIEQFLKETRSQLVLVGTGDTELMDFFNDLQKRFSNQVCAHLQFDAGLPHAVYAGSDAILIPSYFEPSGLTQMEAMRYGAVPIARRVGGLADTIDDYEPGTGEGTGFLFNDFDPNALLIALTRAFVNWRHGGAWRRLQWRIMGKDFSWINSAKEYDALFRKAIQTHKEDVAEQERKATPAPRPWYFLKARE